MILEGQRIMIKATIDFIDLKLTLEDFETYLTIVRKSVYTDGTLNLFVETGRSIISLIKSGSKLQDTDNIDPKVIIMDLCDFLRYVHQYLKPEDKIHSFLGLNRNLKIYSIHDNDGYIRFRFTSSTEDINLEDILKGGKNEEK